MNRNEISFLWDSFTKQALADPTCFLTEDGVKIIQSLRNVDVDPWRCRVRFVAGNRLSRVYSVLLPSCSNLIDLSSPPNFAIKVATPLNESYYRTEISALDQIMPAYYLGRWTVDGDASQSILKDCGIKELAISNTLKESVPNVEGWWNAKYLLTSANVIFMKYGIPVDICQVNLHKCREECLWYLSQIHSSGFLHRDLRISNILNIEGTYRIIDFDHCLPIDECEVEYQCEKNGRTRYLPVFARRSRSFAQQKGDPTFKYKWTKEDDIEMLMFALFATSYESDEEYEESRRNQIDYGVVLQEWEEKKRKYKE
jgi:serine/threonine protein kinase